MTYTQAIIIGLLQGLTELFPISSLGHSVLLPALFGWDNVVSAQAAKESFYLAFLVGLHLATALVLLVFFRRDWVRIIRGFFQTLRTRRLETSDQRLAWLLIAATVPAGLTGLLFEHTFRTLFAKPLAAAIFLTINGMILLLGERYRQRQDALTERPRDRQLPTLHFKEAGIIGTAQVAALLAGISRSGITMVAGLVRGLSHEDAARFSFLLATPIILAAGVYKLPDLLGPNGADTRGQIIVGSLFAALSAYVSVKFLVRYFRSHSLKPFGIYCLVIGILMIIRFA